MSVLARARDALTGRFTSRDYANENPATTVTERFNRVPREVGLLLGVMDQLIERAKPVSDGSMVLVNRQDLKDLELARDLLRAELRSRQ